MTKTQTIALMTAQIISVLPAETQMTLDEAIDKAEAIWDEVEGRCPEEPTVVYESDKEAMQKRLDELMKDEGIDDLPWENTNVRYE